MALNRRLQDEDIAKELILESVSDAYISEDDISPQRDSGEDRTDTGCRDWTNTIQSRTFAPVIHKFTGGPTGFRQNEAPHINKDFATERFHALFFMKLCNCWGNRQTDITVSTWKLLLKDALHCLTSLYRKCTCSYLLFCRWVTTKETD
jgi:hypothetical protein